MFLKQERPEIDDFEECKFLFLHATLGDSSKLFTVLCYHLKLNFRNLLRQHLRVFFCTFFRFLIFIAIHSKRTCSQRLGLQFRLLNIPLFFRGRSFRDGKMRRRLVCRDFPKNRNFRNVSRKLCNSNLDDSGILFCGNLMRLNTTGYSYIRSP